MSAGPLLVLHRVRFEPSQLALLQRAGVVVVSAGSVGQVARALAREDRGARTAVVIDLAVGGASPERVVALCREKGVEVVACRVGRLRSSDARAQKLGIERVYSFPDGCFAAILGHFAAAPSFSLRRGAERARIRGSASGDLEGKLINISAGGALVEASDTAAGAEVSLVLGAPGLQAPVEVRARVCWREAASGERVRLGLEFVAVSDEIKKGIEAYVTEANAVRVRPPVGGTAGASVRVKKEGATRQDYFRLQRDDAGEVLVPRRPFFVPWEPGDSLRVRADGQPERTVRVVERLLLEPGRVDGRVGWRIRDP